MPRRPTDRLSRTRWLHEVTAARQVGEAPWDAHLAETVRANNIAISEERLAPILLAGR